MSAVVSTQGTKSIAMRPFFAIWTGQVFSLLGSELVQFALVWWLTTTTGSATVLALATMMAVLPRVFVSPFAGALIDRWNRRSIMMAADGVSALAVVALGALFALDAVQVWHIYTLMFIRSACAAFHWPAMQASTSLMVPEKHLSRVAGLNQALQGLGMIAAPPLGALLLELLPMQGILAVDVATAILAIAPLVFIQVPQPGRTAETGEASGASMLADLREGLSFLRKWPAMLAVVGIAMVVNLLIYPALSLQPLLVTEHFAGNALQLAWMQSAFGVGMVAGGITLGVWGGFKRRAVTGLLALALNGVGLAVVGLAPGGAFPLAVGASLFAWFMAPFANGAIFALLQAAVPADMQGRVFTLVQAGSGVMVPLGLVIAGPVADALGVQAWFLIAGLVMALIGAVGLSIPALVRLEDQIEASGRGAEALQGSGVQATPAVQ
jgi:DHA3 family macrolide efflux protein-like MFS transporter